MHKKDRMTYHKKQQAYKDNTDHFWTIPMGPVKQKHKDRPCRRHPETVLKKKQTEHDIMHTDNDQANNVPTGIDNSDTKQDNMQQNRSNNSSQVMISVNNEQKRGKDSSEQWTTRQYK